LIRAALPLLRYGARLSVANHTRFSGRKSGATGGFACHGFAAIADIGQAVWKQFFVGQLITRAKAADCCSGRNNRLKNAL
jgi:hypothetical protein